MQQAEKNKENISYCAGMVRGHHRDLYIRALTVPEPAREGLLAIYALATELSHLRHMVSEEMIGHIRYAWWRETLQALYEGNTRAGHPVMEALAPLVPEMPQAHMQALVEAYAASYPAEPQGEDAAIETLSLLWLATHAPEAIPAWKRTHTIISRHRAKHGAKANNWLLLKLLLKSFL